MTIIRRYCRQCKHTTKHEWKDGGARCLAARHSGFRSFLYVLRKGGFKKDWDTRSKINGRDLQFSKDVGDRNLVVQLWQFGHKLPSGRVTHNVRGCSDTAPTDFATVPQMLKAMQVESKRTDNGWLNGSKKFYSAEGAAK